MKIELLEYPTGKDWTEVKRRALVTVGKKPVNPPDSEWKKKFFTLGIRPFATYGSRSTLRFHTTSAFILPGMYMHSRTSAARGTTGRTSMIGTLRGKTQRFP